MRIPAVRAYTDPLVNRTTAEKLKSLEAAVKDPAANGKNGTYIKFNAQNLNDLVSKNERDFFMQMFPDNQKQLQNHVLFNRNGRLQKVSYEKGLIVDGRV